MALPGIGAKFRRWNATGSTWDDIAEIRSIDGPNMTREVFDSSTLDTTGGYRTKISSKLRDPGPVTLSMLFSRDDYDTLQTDFESDTEQNYEIVLPDTDVTSFEFTGFITELPLTTPHDDIITMDVVVEITGAPSTESGSGS